MNSFDNNDIRMQGTILDVNNPEEGNVTTKYVWGSSQLWHETGLWNKKVAAIEDSTIVNKVAGVYSIFLQPDFYPNTTNNSQLWNLQDEILLRFADVLLMGAELGSSSAQSYLDEVRGRVGLSSVPATLENIKAERRHELAGEGLRYFDLLRWHDAEAAFAAMNFKVLNDNVETDYSCEFSIDRCFLKIPETEVRLSGGVLEQNPGWE
jgi:hypothetical protein